MAAMDVMAARGLLDYFLDNYRVFVCDFPGQYHLRKAVMHAWLGHMDPNQRIKTIVSILGPLHLSLNSREMVVLKYISLLWLPFYRFIFGANKVLAKKPKLWRIALIFTLADGGWRMVRSAVLAVFGACADPEYNLYIHILDTLVPCCLDIYAVLFKYGSLDN